MKKFKRFKVNKLIRDNISDLMRSSGINVYDRIMELEEYQKRLKEKLLEETYEVISTSSPLELL